MLLGYGVPFMVILGVWNFFATVAVLVPAFSTAQRMGGVRQFVLQA